MGSDLESDYPYSIAFNSPGTAQLSGTNFEDRKSSKYPYGVYITPTFYSVIKNKLWGPARWPSGLAA